MTTSTGVRQMNPAKPLERHPAPFYEWPDQDKFFVRNVISEAFRSQVHSYPSAADMTIMVSNCVHDSNGLSTALRNMGFKIVDQCKMAITNSNTPEHLRHYGQYNAPPAAPSYVLYWQVSIKEPTDD